MKKIYPIYTTVEKEPKTICRNIDEAAFEYPFLNEGVMRANVQFSEDCDFKLVDLYKEEELELGGLIFNVSHCGSTLLSRMIGQIESVRIVSESEAINGLLLSQKFYSLNDDAIKEQLRRIVKSYQKKTYPKRQLIIKMTSWNVYFIDLILQAFPGVRWIYLDRDTDPLIESLMKKDGGFIDWWNHPVGVLRKRFLGPGVEPKGKEEYLREMIRGHREHAFSVKNRENLFLKYPGFIDQYQGVFDYFRLVPTQKELRAIKEVTKYDAKSRGNKLWRPE